MCSALLPLLAAIAAASPAALAPPESVQVVRHVLPNGVRVIVLRDRTASLVAARALWSGGLRREPPELGGVSWLLASAWTGGCGRLDPDALGRELRGDGASMAGLAGRDTIGLRAEWTRAGWERGFELLADCVASPSFSADAIGRARRRALDVVEERGRSPAWAALDLLDLALGLPTLGALAAAPAFERIDRRQIAEHYRANYPVSSMTLTVVGDVDPQRVLDRARARFGSAERRHPPGVPAQSAPPPERELYRRLVRPDRAAIAIGFPAVGRAHRDRAALEVAAALLDRGSRAALIADADAGHLALYRTCRTEELPSALAALRLDIDRLRDPGPSEEDVRRAASRLSQARRDALARRPQAAAALLALYEVLGPGAEHAARHAALLDAVRAADVRAAAERYLRPDAAVIATAMPLLASPQAARRMREVVRPSRRETARRRPERSRRRRR